MYAYIPEPLFTCPYEHFAASYVILYLCIYFLFIFILSQVFGLKTRAKLLVGLDVNIFDPSEAHPQLGTDESYSIKVPVVISLQLL